VPSSTNTTLPYNGTWYDECVVKRGNSQVAVAQDEAVLRLARSAVLQGKSTAAKLQLITHQYWLDMVAVQGLIHMPPSDTSNNSSASASVSKVITSNEGKGYVGSSSSSSRTTTTTTASNSTSAMQGNTSTAPVALTFVDVTLVNLPPGPAPTYPLGMSTLMMWSIDMDR
jgi:hypothetical protein